jgi:hypothetical protein
MWFRVFGANDVQPEPAALLEHLKGLAVTVPGHFGGDQHGWFRADFPYAADTAPLRLERFLVSEDDIRDDLNAWAAWLETQDENPNVPRLMQLMISTKQVFTLRCPRDAYDEAEVQKLCLGVCQFLAKQTGGVYQVDRAGFFAPDGRELLRENPV